MQLAQHLVGPWLRRAHRWCREGVVQHRRIGVLQDRNAVHLRGFRRLCRRPVVAVGEQQDGGSGQDQEDAEAKAFDDVGHALIKSPADCVAACVRVSMCSLAEREDASHVRHTQSLRAANFDRWQFEQHRNHSFMPESLRRKLKNFISQVNGNHAVALSRTFERTLERTVERTSDASKPATTHTDGPTTSELA